MRLIEIDGKEYEVHGCMDCPCYDNGDSGYYAQCKHPSRSVLKLYGDRYWRECEGGEGYFDCNGLNVIGPFWDKCPLRIVGGAVLSER